MNVVGSPGRVLVLLGPSTGGIRRHVASLRDQLGARGWEVTVAGPAGVMDGMGGQDAIVDIADGPLAVWRAARRVRTLAREVDLVHAHGLTPAWVAVLARCRAPVVATVHNLVLDEVAGRRARLLRLLEKRLVTRTAATIAVSSAIADQLAPHAGRTPVRVVAPLGPPPHPDRSPETVRAGLGVGPGDSLVVSVARLTPQKDLGTLIDAVARLVPDRPRLRLVVAGEGWSRSDLEAHVERSGLSATVILAGNSDNAADELAAADVVVISSRWESGPLVAAEALMLERPLVSTPVGFVSDLIGTAGARLVPVGDRDEMAAAIGELLDDPEKARSLAREGRRRIEAGLGPDTLTEAVVAVYGEVLGCRPVAR